MVPEGWVATQIAELATFRSGGTPGKAEPSYWGGSDPWISGKDLKNHYLDRSVDQLTIKGFKRAKRAPAGATLILVRGMTLLKEFPVGYTLREVAFNQDLKALIPSTSVDGLFLSFLLAGEQHRIRQLVTTAGHGTGRLDTQLIKEYPVNLPPLVEQKKIAKILSTWDEAITTTEQLLANSEQQKSALMQQLLTGKKRLPGFEGKWTYVQVGDVFRRVTRRNGGRSHNVVTISGRRGLIRQEEFFKKSVASETLDGYVLLKKGEFAYSKSYSNGYPMGAIKRLNRYDEAVVSTLYICFDVADEGQADRDFFEYFFEAGLLNHGLSKVANEGGRAHGLLNVKPSDFFSLKIPLPPIEEQRRIAEVIGSAEQEVLEIERDLSLLKQEKKALMQQLLTGRRRVKVDEAEQATA
ncbi:restriction endonuclease subunit S [Ectothiorhodospiraceae bacterium WFHF3C12]|nr:restriction endonuclease subunit S [Ectothiorhodospiraceae bacterium WFHF3C12]